MSRTPKIRWSDNDVKELKRIARNYNAKIRRERKKLLAKDERYLAAQLPQTISVRDLRKEITTRKGLKEELGRMQNYIDTGMKYKVSNQLAKMTHATVRDFNDKVERLEKAAKTQGARAALPEKISSAELYKIAQSEDALRELLKVHRDFLKKGSETLVELPDTKNNIKITKWQKENAEKIIDNVINPERERRNEIRKEAEVIYNGKSAGYTQGELRMDDGDPDELKEVNLYTWSSDNPGLKKKWKQLLRESQSGYWDARTELMRLNYLKKAEEVLGNTWYGKKIINKVKSMPLDAFERSLKSFDDLLLKLYKLQAGSFASDEEYFGAIEDIWNDWFETDFYDVYDDFLNNKVDKLH